MTLNQTMKALKSLGTAQNRKVYARHGVTGDTYGVSYAHLGQLKKKIRSDHDLALALWETSNHDARILATMVAEAERMTARDLDRWARTLDNSGQAAALSSIASCSASAVRRAEKWAAARNEWVATAGYFVLTDLAMAGNELSDTFFANYLKTIETSIHSSKNRVRYAMNNALIAIGARNPGLQKKAVAAARRIGKVEVDHGATGCKTPDAIPYIQKMVARKKARQANRKG